jgi:hypothetical protein
VQQADKEGLVEVEGTSTSVRMKALDVIRAFVARDEKLLEAARAKIRSMARPVPEGSPEWNTILRQLYEQEMDRLRKVK